MATLDSEYLRSPSRLAERRLVDSLLRPFRLESCQALLLLLSDMIALLLAHAAVVMAAGQWSTVAAKPFDNRAIDLLFVLVANETIHLCRGYGGRALRRPEYELECMCKALSLVFAGALAVEMFLLRVAAASVYGAGLWWALSLVLVLTGRVALRSLYARLWKSGYARKRAVLIASGAGLEEFEKRMAVQRYRGYEIAAVAPPAACGVSNRDGEKRDGRLWADSSRLCDIVSRVMADVVIVSAGALPVSDPLVLDIVRECRETGIAVELCSALFADGNIGYEIDGGSGCLRFHPQPHWARGLQRGCKRLMDLGIGLVGSLATLLLIPVVWLLLKLEDGGPLFHRREFVGCDGRIRYYLKFRTMVADADNVLQANPEMLRQFSENHKLRDDPRILKIGRIMRRLSIDEFPQFLSVLSGRLTFVGPRVISSAETARYGACLAKRLTVKPGMTGYWQVMGRQTTSYDERILMDMFYIDHWSIWLDLVIFGKTFCKFLAPEGAY